MSKLDTDLAIMHAAGLEDDEILRLAGLRRRVAVGICSELTVEHKRLVFGKHLYEIGQVSELDDADDDPE